MTRLLKRDIMLYIIFVDAWTREKSVKMFILLFVPQPTQISKDHRAKAENSFGFSGKKGCLQNGDLYDRVYFEKFYCQGKNS